MGIHTVLLLVLGDLVQILPPSWASSAGRGWGEAPEEAHEAPGGRPAAFLHHPCYSGARLGLVVLG